MTSSTNEATAILCSDTMSADRLRVLIERVTEDTDKGSYHGAALKIARHGELVLDLAVGYADAQRTVPLRTDSVFSVFSITKAFINVLTLKWIERGRFALTTRMSELVPEFSGPPRDRATIFNFLTHTTGLPGVWEPAPALYLDVLDDAVEAVVKYVRGTSEPGTRCDYSPMAAHVLLAEAIRRTDPQHRTIAQILDEEIFVPLGMKDTALGIKPHMRDRHIVPDMRGVVPIKSLSRTAPGDSGLFVAESNEATWAGGASTTMDLMRFAEMLRRGGEGIVSPRMLALARRNWTGDMPNELYKTVALQNDYTVPPAYLGLGFNVRGQGIVNTQLGTLTSEETFGNYGAGSALFWVDPALDLVFVGLTSGLLPQADNIERFQRLSDMAVAAAL
ncbi:serine hydrolase domain-containing protein [Arthrobacter sp. YN]|uniref:serine hydrolase domain-containing protein n=1 Tax=Arthrobacter sp. YN TaxID=2020486 RepID=UPI000B5E9B26|nr:serine hydrolase domain-containing protein [Arthrobacter sp. YN]ASN20150.1 serine hydrolase [Arthrobacter sp. YN]